MYRLTNILEQVKKKIKMTNKEKAFWAARTGKNKEIAAKYIYDNILGPRRRIGSKNINEAFHLMRLVDFLIKNEKYISKEKLSSEKDVSKEKYIFGDYMIYIYRSDITDDTYDAVVEKIR